MSPLGDIRPLGVKAYLGESMIVADHVEHHLHSGYISEQVCTIPF